MPRKTYGFKSDGTWVVVLHHFGYGYPDRWSVEERRINKPSAMRAYTFLKSTSFDNEKDAFNYLNSLIEPNFIPEGWRDPFENP